MTDLVRQWKTEGLTLAQIQALCSEHGVTTRRGTTPGISTIAKWTEGIHTKSKKEKPGVKRGTRSPKRLETSTPGLLATISDLKLKGFSLQQIATELFNRGYTTKNGTPYTKVQVWRIVNRNTQKTTL